MRAFLSVQAWWLQKKVLNFIAITALFASPTWAAPLPTHASLVRGGGCVRDAPGQACNAVTAEIVTGVQGSFVAGADGATLQLVDRSTATLDPGTEVRLLPTMSVALASPTWAQVFQILKGKVECTVAANPPAPTAVLVRGPGTISAIVKQGTSVLRLYDERVAMGVLSGAGLAAAKNDWGDVTERKVRVLDLKSAKLPVRPFVEPPVLEGIHTLDVQNGRPGPPLAVRWAPVANAESYEIVLTDGTGAKVKTQRVNAQQLSFQVADLAPGFYTVTVRGVTLEDVDLVWSKPMSLNVASVELPPGASVNDQGVIQIPGQQRLKLSPVTGLETAMGASSPFDAPRSEIGLLGESMQILRIRQVGSKEEASLKMEPRAAKAEIEFSPKNPRWPGQDVTVTLRLLERNGSPSTAALEMRPVAHLNAAPIDLKWTKEHATVWHAVLPARANGRPNVLHVEVKDQFGYRLGQSFLEIAYATENNKLSGR